MGFRHKKIAVALACALGATGGGLLSPARAASDIKVDVTGSNIKRIEGETALPVQVITREEIAKTGVTNAMELLDRIAVNSGVNSYALTQAFNDSARIGFAGASLRGLGFNKTLVLLDGRRIVNYAHDGTGVDLNSIPLSAIERVEVLKDGASAIYGSDAIAGVINFILRNDYQGAEVTAYGGDTFSGGASEWSGTGTVGFGDLSKDKYNAFVSAQYFKQRPLFGRDRPWLNSSYIPAEGFDITSGRTFPANVNIPGVGNRNPLFPNCAPSLGNDIFFPPDAQGRGECRFDPNPFLGVIPTTERINVVAKATWQFNPNAQLYAEGNYNHNKYNFVLQPAPLSQGTLFPAAGADAPGFFLPATSPFYPHAFAQQFGIDGQPLNIQWRPFDNGLRDSTTTSEQSRFVVGSKGTLWKWDYDVGYSYNESKDRDHLNAGYSSQAALLPLLSSGLVNPFATNTPDIINQLHSTWLNADARNSKATVHQVDGKVTNEIYNLPAGPLAVAVGGEYRKEKLEQISSPILATGDIIGYGTSSPSTFGDRKAYAFFGELNIPVVKTVEGNAAVRYDHYSDFGSTTNPKFSVRWQPFKAVLFRSAWGTGFRAPALPELNTPQAITNTQAGLSDPLRCPITGDAVLDCRTQFQQINGGNPSLKPERSEQWTLGSVVEPLDGLSIGIDAFKINVTDQIGVNNAGVILTDLNRFGQFITRGPVDSHFPNLPGPITAISTTFANLGAARIIGADVDLRFRFPKSWMGQFKLGLSGTYYHKYDVQNADGSWTNQIAQSSGALGAISRWKHYATLDWDYGPWGATLAQTYQQGYVDENTNLNNDLRRVGDYDIYDLQGRFSGFKNIEIAAGVKNVFNKAPPYTNQNFTFITGYDPSYADPRGAFYYASITYRFK